MLQDKVVLVTGGTGAIGSAICRIAAREGARVAFTYHRQTQKAESLSRELKAAGCEVIYAQVDGRDGPGVEAFVQRVEAEFSEVDALVNNLGLAQVMPFALLEEEDWDETIEVNLKSMFLFSRAVVRGMIRRRSGVILNLSSLAAIRLLEVPVHYATAKAGVMGFTISLAKELSRYSIRVVAVAPGLIDGGVGSNVSERQLADYESYCALGRQGTPDEVAELVCFAISDRASYLNAQTLVLDGGL